MNYVDRDKKSPNSENTSCIPNYVIERPAMTQLNYSQVNFKTTFMHQPHVYSASFLSVDSAAGNCHDCILTQLL
jgi:hypothetical protein